MYENVYRRMCWFVLGVGGVMMILQRFDGMRTYTFENYFTSIAIYAFFLFAIEAYKLYKK